MPHSIVVNGLHCGTGAVLKQRNAAVFCHLFPLDPHPAAASARPALQSTAPLILKGLFFGLRRLLSAVARLSLREAAFERSYDIYEEWNFDQQGCLEDNSVPHVIAPRMSTGVELHDWMSGSEFSKLIPIHAGAPPQALPCPN